MKYVVVEFVDHLDVTQVDTELQAIQGEVDQRGGTIALVVDAARMTGYDAEARQAFVTWNRNNKAKITSVAIVTNRPLWHMVIRAMSLASSQVMRPFQTREEAECWAALSVDGESSIA